MVKLDTVAGFCVISWGDWTTGLVLLCRLLLCIHPILILEGPRGAFQMLRSYIFGTCDLCGAGAAPGHVCFGLSDTI